MRQSARVVVVGAGFAGASFIRSLPPALRRQGETLLVDREERYPFIPLIHEVAVGRVHPESILSSIASLCKGRCRFLQAEVTGLDLENKTLETTSGDIGYEYLVLTTGSVGRLPPKHLRGFFRPFWNLEDALRLRSTLNDSWHQSIRRASGQLHQGDLTVAVVGGGSTGVELSAEIAALFAHLKKRTSRHLPKEPRVVLIEATSRLMGWLNPYFHEVAMAELSRLGVEVWLNAPVEDASEEGVKAREDWLPARTRIWTTGVETPPLARNLPGEHDPSGRIRVDEHLTLPGHPEIHVLGDAALYEDPRHGILPPTASVAVQQGPFATRDVGRRLRRRKRPPFDFFNRGYVVSLGPESGVGEAVGVRLRGPAAQALYRSIFLYYLKDSRERALLSADWAMERAGRIGFG